VTFEPSAFSAFTLGRALGARWPLQQSGVAAVRPSEFLAPETIATAADALHAGAATDLVREQIGARYDVPPANVLPARGTTGGLHLAIAAITTLAEDDAPVAVERPGYPVFGSIASLAGRDVVDVPRPAAYDGAVDLDAADEAFRRGACVLCLSDLHNPTGVALAATDLAALDEIAARHGAWVLVDEIYRDFLPGRPGTAWRAGSRIVATSSFTKTCGLGALRTGWIVAAEPILRRAAEIDAVTSGPTSAPWAHFFAAVLPHASHLTDRGRRIAAAGRPVIDAWIETQAHVSWTPPAAGVSGFLRIEGLRRTSRFAEALRRELDVQVIAGDEFGDDSGIRVGFGLPPAELASALDVLALGIGALRTA
jgi:aspartate/methionine/tyrosine aminotransferase